MKKIHIIHGWTYTLNAWEQVVDLLQVANFDPVQLKVPGLTTPSDKVWTLDEYVEWLKEELEGESEVYLVGHSNGGRIAIAFVNKYPELVSKLVLVDAAGIVHKGFFLQMKRKVFGALAKVGKTFAQVPLIRKIFYRLIGARDYEAAPVNMRETMKNMITTDLAPVISNITLPTLIIWGKKDTATPLSDGEYMHKHIEDSQLYVIDDAGHSPHLSHPKEVSRFLAEWFS